VTFEAPPHGRAELLRAQAAVVKASRAVAVAYHTRHGVLHAVTLLADAVSLLDRLDAENDAHAERRRADALAAPTHYVLEVGARLTVCGLDAADVMHGWVGPGGAYLRRRVANGGTVCDGCSAGMPVAVWLDTEVTP
jgi:hypothetical protein